MKYDPDIALQILQGMEALERDEILPQTNLLPNIDIGVYFSHCRWLSERGYISVYNMSMQGKVTQYWPRELKYAGVQFLQMFQNESLWQRAKKEASTKGVGLTLENLMKIGADLMGKIISGHISP